MGVGPHEGHMLKLFGEEVYAGLGFHAYQVGSSLTQKRGWRDVDVRCMVPEETFAELGLTVPERLAAWNLAWTALGRQMTNLPIDFQIQDRESANAEFGGRHRSALIVVREGG